MDSPSPVRKIIHIDMDAFFASVEQRDDPALRGLPVVVGGAGPRGVVAAASYEARRFGVRSAMASARARRLCPDLIFVPHRFEVYRSVSAEIRALFDEVTPLVQPLSLDEAYLDVTENHWNEPSATRIAERLRDAIRAKTGLTASAGVSYNKFLAKLASDQNKPDGLCVIPPDKGEAFVGGLPVSRFHGVGPVTARKMEHLGIVTGEDLRRCDRAFLDSRFGKSGGYLYWAARGIDNRPVNPDQVRKSVGTETTFGEDLRDADACLVALAPLVEKTTAWCARRSVSGRTVTVKARFSDFRTVTRSRSLKTPTHDPGILSDVVGELVRGLAPLPLGVRLLGVTLSNLSSMGAAGADQGQGRLL